MHVSFWEPMPSRPCRVCLSLEEGSVFADFDVNPKSGCLYLARISFDGHGCCEAPADVTRMSVEESRLLIEMAEAGASTRVPSSRSSAGIWLATSSGSGATRSASTTS